MDFDGRVAGKDRRCVADDVAEEYDLGEAERRGASRAPIDVVGRGSGRHDRLGDLFLACLAVREVESEADHGDDCQRDDLGELVLQGR